MATIQRCRYFIILLTVIIFLTVSNFRYKSINCALCKDQIYLVSATEYYFGPFKEVPTLHPNCQDFIVSHLAPNSFMNIKEWLQVRGWYGGPNSINKDNQEHLDKVEEMFQYDNEER